MIRPTIAVAAILVACTIADATVAVRDVYVVRGAGLAPGALYATLVNGTERADTLVGIDLDRGNAVELHETVRDASGAMTMHGVGRLAVPPRTNVRLAPGGTHGMVAGLRASLARGDSLAITFRFLRHGAVSTFARVIDYDQVDALLGRGAQ